MQVFVRDDLVQVGLTEDGEADIARRFYVVAEAPNGARWAHDYCIVAHRRDEDQAQVDIDRLCAKIAAHLAAGGKLNEQHWNETYPAYGSAHYQSLDATGYFRALERQDARDAGENVPYDEPCDAWFAL